MKKLKITLKKSPIGVAGKRARNLDGLGLRRRHQECVRENTPSVRGMVKKVLDLVEVVETESD
jgi:large subunit ribosomal protein L30